MSIKIQKVDFFLYLYVCFAAVVVGGEVTYQHTKKKEKGALSTSNVQTVVCLFFPHPFNQVGFFFRGTEKKKSFLLKP